MIYSITCSAKIARLHNFAEASFKKMIKTISSENYGFKSRYVVQLNSGGPEMTVRGIIGDSSNPISKSEETALKLGGHNDGDIYCQWFDSSGELKSGCFKQVMLEEVDD